MYKGGSRRHFVAQLVPLALIIALVCYKYQMEWRYLAYFKDNDGGQKRLREGTSSSDKHHHHPPLDKASSSSLLRNQTGSWIGNYWVPPLGWKVYSARAMRDLYRHTSVLWVGDSTARRSAMTLYGILAEEDEANSNSNDNSTDNNVPVRLMDGSNILDVNKDKGKRFPQENCTKYDNDDEIPISICRPLWGAADYPDDKLFSWYRADCTVEVHDWLLHQLLEINQTSSSASPSLQQQKQQQQQQHTSTRITPDYNLVVISLGIWEAVRSGDCRTAAAKSRSSNHTRQSTLDEITNAMLDRLEQLCTQQPELTVLWRTSGFHKDGLGTQMIQDWNTRVMDRIDQFAARRRQEGQPRINLLYVNFGEAIALRSFGKERIDGDLKPHYGLAARYALLQMMANALADHEYNQGESAV